MIPQGGVLLKLSISTAVSDAFIENSDGLATSRRYKLSGEVLAGFITNLITGSYFTGLLLAIGASDTYISFVTMATSLCGILQLLSPLLLERMGKRKRFLIGVRSLYHLISIVFIGVIPVLPLSNILILILFMACVIIMNLLHAMSVSGIAIWQMQSLPAEKQNSYFTISNMVTTLIGVLTVFCAGKLLDGFEDASIGWGSISPTITALWVLRLFALAAAIGEILCYLRIKEMPYLKDKQEKNNHGIRLLLLPLRNKAFMLTTMITFIWLFTGALIGSYYTIYLIDVAKLSYTMLSLGGIISVPIFMLLTPIWSKMIARFGWQKMLSLSIAGTSLAYFFNTVVTAENQTIYYLVIVICYLFNPALNIIFAFLPYTNMPETNRTAYRSFYALTGTLANFLGNLCGTFFMRATEDIVLPIFGLQMTNYQYFNFIQMFLLLLLSMYLLWLRKKI